MVNAWCRENEDGHSSNSSTSSNNSGSATGGESRHCLHLGSAATHQGRTTQCAQWRERDNESDEDSVSTDSSEDEDESESEEDKNGSTNDGNNDDGPVDDEEVEVSDGKQIENTSSTTKQTWDEARGQIIREMQNKNSDIHLLLSAKATQKAKSERILDKFAPDHKQENRVNSIVRLLGDFKNKRAPHFSEKKKNDKDGKPFWRSRSKSSEAASLLYKLLVHPDKTGINGMDVKEIYKHHKVFHQYDQDDFKVYYKTMLELANKHRCDHFSYTVQYLLFLSLLSSASPLLFGLFRLVET